MYNLCIIFIYIISPPFQGILFIPDPQMTFVMKKWLIQTGNKILGNYCTTSLFINYNYQDVNCLKLAASKTLSLGIISGAMFVKLPQIFKVLLSRSTEGISFLTYTLETMATSINFAYNWRNGNPFTTYGETIFVTFQNIIIILLMGIYQGHSTQLIMFLVTFLVFMSCLLVPSYVGPSMLGYLQAMTIPLFILSRLPQILKAWLAGNTGQLSAITLSLVTAGSWARVFTTLQEVRGDQLLLIGFALGALLNSILMAQMLWYWNSQSRHYYSKPSASSHKKKN